MGTLTQQQRLPVVIVMTGFQPPGWASADGTSAGTVALPTMAGLANLGTFGIVVRSTRVTVKPASWMDSRVRGAVTASRTG